MEGGRKERGGGLIMSYAALLATYTNPKLFSKRQKA